jgi:hypothetical protein
MNYFGETLNIAIICSGVTTPKYICYKAVVSSIITGRWFSPGTPVSTTNKTDRHHISEILLKVAINTINQTQIT